MSSEPGRRAESAPGQESDPPIAPAPLSGVTRRASPALADERRRARPMHRPRGGAPEGALGALDGCRGALLVPVEVARRRLLEPQPVVLGRLLEEVRRLLQHVLGGRLAGSRRRRAGARAPRRRAPRRARRRATDPRRSSAAGAGGSSAAGSSASTSNGSRSSAGVGLGRVRRGLVRRGRRGLGLGRLRLGGLRLRRLRELGAAARRRAPRAPGARPRPGSAPWRALELEMLADGVVEQSHAPNLPSRLQRYSALHRPVLARPLRPVQRGVRRGHQALLVGSSAPWPARRRRTTR